MVRRDIPDTIRLSTRRYWCGIQSNYRRTVGFANPEQRFAVGQDAVVYGLQHQLTYGMTTRVVADWLQRTLQTELLAVVSFDPGNNVVRPLMTYAVSDRRKIRFGAEYYTGPDLSYFGALKRNRTIFMEVQQFF
jgi:hypothetical protein